MCTWPPPDPLLFCFHSFGNPKSPQSNFLPTPLPSYTQSKAQMHHPRPENFLTIGGYFECYTYRVTALGWLKKEEKEEERKKMTAQF